MVAHPAGSDQRIVKKERMMAETEFTALKQCGVCCAEKPASEFYRSKTKRDGLSWNCKACDKNKKIEYLKNPKALQKNKAAQVKKYQKNKVILLAKARDRYKSQRSILIERVIQWQQDNPDKRAESRRLDNQKPLTRLKKNIRSRIRAAMLAIGHYKKDKTASIIGCDWYQFKVHIEKQFTSGMCWEKMGREIHIDHICPVSTAETEEDVLALSHFTNLRPLWAKDNLSKSAKITHLI